MEDQKFAHLVRFAFPIPATVMIRNESRFAAIPSKAKASLYYHVTQIMLAQSPLRALDAQRVIQFESGR